MATFSDVAPGERWRPEPAERYNAVNAAVNRIDAGGVGTAPRLPANRGALVINAVVSSGASVGIYTAVALSGAVVKQNPTDPADAIFRVASTASGGEEVWGIAQMQTQSGGCVIPVLLQGLTPAIVSGGVDPGTQLAPGSSGALVSSGGAARALLKTIADRTLTLVQLGFGAGGEAAPPEPYNGYFKITMAAAGSSSYRVTVADGATGSNSYAVVNGGSTYTLPPYRETITSGALYLLKYTPAQYNSGGSVVSSATMVLSSIHQSGGTFPVLPSGGTDGAYYYQIGRVIWSSGSAPTQVAQDHTTGVVYFQWFINCNQYAQ